MYFCGHCDILTVPSIYHDVHYFVSFNINHLNHNDASRHHFASLKYDLIYKNLGVIERKFSWNCLNNNIIIFSIATEFNHFHSLQAANCENNSRLADEDDSCKFRLERVKIQTWCCRVCTQFAIVTSSAT